MLTCDIDTQIGDGDPPAADVLIISRREKHISTFVLIFLLMKIFYKFGSAVVAQRYNYCLARSGSGFDNQTDRCQLGMLGSRPRWFRGNVLASRSKVCGFKPD